MGIIHFLAAFQLASGEYLASHPALKRYSLKKKQGEEMWIRMS